MSWSVWSGFSSAEGGFVTIRSGIAGPSGPRAPRGRFALRQRASANTAVLYTSFRTE